MKIIRKKLAEITPAPYNPRVHTETFINNLKNSLIEFGYVEPIIWNKQTGNCVGGHARLKVLLADGIEEEDVVEVYLPLEKEKQLNVILNSVLGEFDNAKLGAILTELQALDVDLKALNFTQKELNVALAETYPPTEDLDDLPPTPTETNVKRGDIYQLGRHKIMCGDSTNPDDVKSLMQDEKATILLTDPPYGVDYGDIADSRPLAAVLNKTGVAPKAKKRDEWDSIANDDLTDERIRDFLISCFNAIKTHLKEDAAWYLWHAQKTQGFFTAAAAAAAAADVIWHRQIVWVKPQLILGRGDYHWRHELLFYGWVKGHRPPFYGERNQTTVWECPSPHAREHPTQKPIEIMTPPILNHSQEDEIILDPFLGSGSTLIAAKTTKRRCYGLEIEPKYIDVIIKRWETLTKQKATKIN